jgi:exopolysaccharide biosynthesis polyprenyl glycosylphosphotransferase
VATHTVSGALLRWWRRRGKSYRQALIIGTGPAAMRAADRILAEPERGIRIAGFLDQENSARLWRYRDIPLVGTVSALPELIKTRQIDYAVFCPEGETLSFMHDAIASCARMGVTAVVVTDWFADLAVRPRAAEFFGHPGLILDTVRPSVAATIAKDIIDRVLAAIGILVTLPLMIAAACTVKLSSRGPAIFSQTRLGRNGRPFTIWKLRTMVSGADAMKHALRGQNEMSGPVFKMSRDPRMTRIGKILRRMSIDELPQLFNVLRGDMSLVGPRPHLPEEVRQYAGWERRRLSVKPGLTGLWQVRGRSNVDFEEWMRLDLEYIDNWSPRQDARILAETIPAVLRGSGAK